MRDRDVALDTAITEVAAILGDALVRLLSPDPADQQVDLPEIESPHVTAGSRTNPRSVRLPLK